MFIKAQIETLSDDNTGKLNEAAGTKESIGALSHIAGILMLNSALKFELCSC